MNEFASASWEFYLLALIPTGYGWYAKISNMQCLEDTEVICSTTFKTRDAALESITTFIRENGIIHSEVSE